MLSGAGAQGDTLAQTTATPVAPGAVSDGAVEQKTPGDGAVRFTAIGDSVMLGAAPALLELFPDSVVDAAESRQVWAAGDIAAGLDAQGRLYDTVIIALGSNGSFSQSQGQALLDSLGSEREIYWVAPYGKTLYWTDSTLEILLALEAENENLTVLNWRAASEQHGDWFYDDGLHLNAAGQQGYAQFIKDGLSA